MSAVSVTTRSQIVPANDVDVEKDFQPILRIHNVPFNAGGKLPLRADGEFVALKTGERLLFTVYRQIAEPRQVAFTSTEERIRFLKRMNSLLLGHRGLEFVSDEIARVMYHGGPHSSLMHAKKALVDMNRKLRIASFEGYATKCTDVTVLAMSATEISYDIMDSSKPWANDVCLLAATRM